MKKIKLLALPLLAFSLASCGEGSGQQEFNGNIDDLLPTEFDFNNYSKEAVIAVLDNLQHNSGYEIKFKVAHYANTNDEVPSLCFYVTIGGKDSLSWAIEEHEEGSYGVACNVESDIFTYYIQEDGVWKHEEDIEYSKEEIAEEVHDFIDEEVDQLVIRDEYLSKIDFSASVGTDTVCSRSCYKFVYNEDYLLTIKVDKILGLVLSSSVTYVDVNEGIATRECIEVQSIALSNIVPPELPKK